MTWETVSFHDFMKRIAKLEAKFPLTDRRKQDIADAETLEIACRRVTRWNFEKLADLMDETARLKKRYTLNLKLLNASNLDDLLVLKSREATAAIWASEHIAKVRKSKKPEDAKVKEITQYMKLQIHAASKSASKWADLATRFDQQFDSICAVSARISLAQKALSATLSKAADDATHRRMGEIILEDLRAIDALVSETCDPYVGLMAQARNKRHAMALLATEGRVQLAKLKAKNAFAYLEKMAA